MTRGWSHRGLLGSSDAPMAWGKRRAVISSRVMHRVHPAAREERVVVLNPDRHRPRPRGDHVRPGPSDVARDAVKRAVECLRLFDAPSVTPPELFAAANDAVTGPTG